jgi:hypothetical protein
MARWSYTSGGQLLTQIMITVLILQPLLVVTQTYPKNPLRLHDVLHDLLDLLHLRAAHAAEVGIEIYLIPGFNFFAYPVEMSPGLTCTAVQTPLGATTFRRLNAQSQQFEACTVAAGPFLDKHYLYTY